jgi:platelet-activating factor acetylhydrolase
VQRASEARKVIDVLECLEKGLLNQSDNMITGKGGLKVNIFQGRLDLQHIAISGHSFGGATAILTSGNDKRIKCCVAMDVWWEPIKEVKSSHLFL